MSDKYNSSYTGAEIDEAVGHALNLGGSGNAAPQSSVTPVETSPSTHGYTVGKLLTYNGQLYRVIASISIGDTLTVNTNIAATTIADEIDGIVTDISTSTPTNINGVLVGDGSKVGVKTLDTSTLSNDVNHIPASSVVKSALDALTTSFTVTLAAASWSSNAQTVNNANFVASGYAYVVSPASASFSAYASAQIYADDVTTDGSMTFHCATTPSSDLTVNILREAAT